MSPEDIIGEACKLPLPALEMVAEVLGFEVLGRLQYDCPDQKQLGRGLP
ncbi:MAG: hypothetical protein HPY61_13825 [Methanotrichaceae archaeon]|nr:hypothetical protein [Methanotrichaceae archaeon]